MILKNLKNGKRKSKKNSPLFDVLAKVHPRLRALVFGLDLKCLDLWQLLLLTCAAPTHAQKYLGKNTFIYLFVSPIDAGSQKCTQGTPSVKDRKKYYLKLVNWYLRSGSKYYANICGLCLINFTQNQFKTFKHRPQMFT